MAELIAPIAARRGDAPALIDEHGTVSWHELDRLTNRLISGMRSAGVNDDDVIALMCGNRSEVMLTYCGALHSRWVVVPINWHLVADEVAYILENSAAATVIVDEAHLEVVEAARLDPRTARVEHWIVVGSERPGYVTFDTLLASGSDEEPPSSGMGGPMFYTSGTTGFPKGVRTVLSNTDFPTAMFPLIAGSFSSMLGIPVDGVTFLNGPAYHSAQWVFSMFPLIAGSTVVMRHQFDAAETLRVIDEFGVTNTHLVPTQFIRLLRLDDATRGAFSGASLTAVFHGAAPCSLDVKRSMLEWWGPVVHEYYGGTEGGFISMIRGDEWPDRPGSLGRALEIIELRLIAENGRECEPGETGQIWFRNTLGSDFTYHGDPEKTAAAHASDGFGTLGDIGHVDADGYLFLSDRKIDMIISGGVNIYPAEIEGVLVDHPAVADAAVFGVPDEEMGERVMAVVELVDANAVHDPEVLAAELIAHVRSRLAGYKAPRELVFTAALPRTPTGKLTKRILRDPYWQGIDRSI